MQFRRLLKRPFLLLGLCSLFFLGNFWGCTSVQKSAKTHQPEPAAITSIAPSQVEGVQEKAETSEAAKTAKPVSVTITESVNEVSKGSSRVETDLPYMEERGEEGTFCKQAPQGQNKKGENAKKEPYFDIPIVMNPLVENFIKYYQTTGRKQFSIWLARSERYIPMMKKVLKEHGLPMDLVYLAMIESGFNPRAYSKKRASGPWQFIPGTGRKYGLKVNYWIDERRDPEKSTVAAARYLKDLYDQFESWHLAAAAYNCGEGKLNRAIKRYKTEDYWQLIQHHYLKRETRYYVPQMIAAALIAKEPEKYGFTNIQYQEPLNFERASVPGGVTLKEIAKACHCEEQTLRMLNPELIRRCTPPYTKRFSVKIPKGTKQILALNMSQLKPVVKGTPHGWVHTHIVRRGDTLYKLSRKYRARISDIRYLNHLKGNLLHVGQRLIIPAGRVRHPTYARKKSHRVKTARRSNGKRQKKVARNSSRSKYKEIVYVVRKGDNLWSIARSFNIRVKDICRLNPHVSKRTTLHPKDRLKLRVPMAEFSSVTLTARPVVQ
ncbi:MAG: lytic transglycosylase [Deltaproteobacteria bacterium]|nr:MAG: lytic transglycosylase [Deltaproteobacteria bacterium]